MNRHAKIDRGFALHHEGRQGFEGVFPQAAIAQGPHIPLQQCHLMLAHAAVFIHGRKRPKHLRQVGWHLPIRRLLKHLAQHPQKQRRLAKLPQAIIQLPQHRLRLVRYIGANEHLHLRLGQGLHLQLLFNSQVAPQPQIPRGEDHWHFGVVAPKGGKLVSRALRRQFIQPIDQQQKPSLA